MRAIFTYSFNLALLLGVAGSVSAQGNFTASPIPSNKVPFADLGELIGQIFTFGLILGGVFFFIFLLIGGLQWVTAGGDKAHLESARNRITSALIGLVLIVAAFAVTKVIETIFGIRVISGIGIN